MSKNRRGIYKNKLDSEDYYITDQGCIILTDAYHIKRGYCCKSGCKHCPYGFKKISEL